MRRAVSHPRIFALTDLLVFTKVMLKVTLPRAFLLRI